MNTFYAKRLKLLFIYSLSLFLFSSSFGQIDSRISLAKICHNPNGGGISENACKTDSYEGRIVSKSPNEVEIIIFAHALDIPTISDENVVSFPKEYPALHLRYEYSPNVYKYTKPLLDWKFVDQLTAEDGKVHLLYRAQQKVRVLIPKNTECNPESSTINFSSDNSLYTFSDENNKWEEYPIYEYSGPNDIFSCKIFKETMHVCDPKLKPMELITNIEICVPCRRNTKQISVLSNPFSETLYFNYNSKNASELNVSLLSLNGETISNQSLSTEAGMNRMQILADNISRGTYFLSIFDGEENFVQKVVCVK